MVFILGASSFHHALEKFPAKAKKRYAKIVYTAPGLSFNPSCKNPRKTVQFILKHFFPYRRDLVIWNDVLNNSISQHVSSNYTSLTPQELVNTLNQFRSNVAALLYCRGDGTKDIYGFLKRQFFTISILKDIISKRKAKSNSLVKSYQALHQKHELELKTLFMVLRNSCYLNRIVAKSQPKRPNKRRRRALKNKQLRVGA